jgi:hypothetical protein
MSFLEKVAFSSFPQNAILDFFFNSKNVKEVLFMLFYQTRHFFLAQLLMYYNNFQAS